LTASPQFDRLTGMGRPGPARSLRRDAWTRLKHNRAAVASAIGLVLVSLACLVGPLFSLHNYDTVYRSYVKVAPSLDAYPRQADIDDALRRAFRRTGAALEHWEETGAGLRIYLLAEGERPIRDDIQRYLSRLGDFSNVREAARLDGGRRVVLAADAARLHFLLGTDANGRDLLTRILIGGRISLAIGILATAVALAIGVAYGAIAGFLGGRVDDFMMRFVDILYSLPFIFLVIVLVVLFGRNFVLIFVAVGAIEWLDMARIVRGQALSLKRQEFIEAAQALGVSGGDIIRRHIIPNAAGPVVVYLTLLVPKVILLESFLSFLGLGVQEPLTSWGVLISEGARNIQDSWWLLVFPSLFLTATLFCLNFLGDGLRDALDPKDRR
jgi:oligopeptide transport system permease protein